MYKNMKQKNEVFITKNKSNYLIFKTKFICWLTNLTRKWYFNVARFNIITRIIEKIFRLIHNPDKRNDDFIETIITYDKNSKIHINTSSFLEWQIFFRGYYELEIVNSIKKYLVRGGTFVDVGVNVGIHSIIASKIAGKVIAIEPVEDILDRFQKNCKLNKINNVFIFKLAASDKEETTLFYPPKEKAVDNGVGSLYKGHTPDNTVQEIKVKTKTLDDILRDEKRVDYIKIDTEGHDGRIIMGSLNIIKKHHPFIVFEFVEPCWKLSGVTLEMVKKELELIGYSFKRIGKRLDNCNILCIPSDKNRKIA